MIIVGLTGVLLSVTLGAQVGLIYALIPYIAGLICGACAAGRVRS